MTPERLYALFNAYAVEGELRVRKRDLALATKNRTNEIGADEFNELNCGLGAEGLLDEALNANLIHADELWMFQNVICHSRDTFNATAVEIGRPAKCQHRKII